MDPNDKMEIDEFIRKAQDNLYMSTIVIAAEIDRALEMYAKHEIRRDDIIMGLEQIALATGRRIGVLL